MEHETQVVALELAHGEAWTYFADSGVYAIARELSLADLHRAVAEMTVHARMVRAAPAA